MGSFRKLWLTTAVAFLLLFTGVSVLVYRAEQRLLTGALESRARSISGVVAKVLAAERSNESLREFLVEHLGSLPNMRWVEILDSRGSVIAHTASERVGGAVAPEHAKCIARVLAGEQEITASDEREEELAYFVRVAAGDSPDRQGSWVVGLGLDTSHIQEKLNGQVTYFGGLVLLAALVFYVGLVLARRHVVGAERARRSAEEQAALLGLILEASPHELYLFDAQSLQFERVNAGARRNLGYSMEELRHMTPLDLKHSYSRPEFEALLQPLRSGTTDQIVFETEHWRRNGTSYPVRVQLGLSDVGGAPLFVAMIFDQTEEKERNRKLQETQKMEAVGKLAAGVAHDFNNLLTSIQGSAELIRWNREGDELQQDLDQIGHAVDRASALTRKLLAFGRRQSNHPVHLDLNTYIADFVPLLRRMIREDIVIETEWSAVPAVVMIDRGNLEQIVTNLVVNSRDAMAQGGRVRIAVAIEPGVAGDVAALEVTDTGAGIPRDVAERVFEPFFSTKDPTRGSGLGLATVKDIVEQAGGTIELRSEVQVGTTALVRLPLVDAVGSDCGRTRHSLEPATGTESILVCEDDGVVLDTVARQLVAAGYRVIRAADSATAGGLIETVADLDLLVTDIVMPGLSGYELAARARTAGLAVLFMTGYDPEGDEAMRQEWSEARFLAKPFTKEELLGSVRDVLDANVGVGGSRP